MPMPTEIWENPQVYGQWTIENSQTRLFANRLRRWKSVSINFKVCRPQKYRVPYHLKSSDKSTKFRKPTSQQRLTTCRDILNFSFVKEKRRRTIQHPSRARTSWYDDQALAQGTIIGSLAFSSHGGRLTAEVSGRPRPFAPRTGDSLSVYGGRAIEIFLAKYVNLLDSDVHV